MQVHLIWDAAVKLILSLEKTKFLVTGYVNFDQAICYDLNWSNKLQKIIEQILA